MADEKPVTQIVQVEAEPEAEAAAQVTAAAAAAHASIAAEAAEAAIAGSNTVAAQAQANAADQVRNTLEEQSRWRQEIETKFEARLADVSSSLTAQANETRQSLQTAMAEISSALNKLQPQPDPPPSPNEPPAPGHHPAAAPGSGTTPQAQEPPAPRRRAHRWT